MSDLVQLLSELLSEERLPPVDRWFGRYARERRWSPSRQKVLWDDLRRTLCRGFLLVPEGEYVEWQRFRVELRGRVHEWAAVTEAAPASEPRAAGIPGAWIRSWNERVRLSAWGPVEREQFLKLQSEAAPTYLRFRYGNEGQELREAMIQTGQAARTPVDSVLKLVSGQGLEGTDAWRRGLVEIQDAASQLSLARLDLRPGQRVWDVCAGRGGKTLLAASELRGKGVLLATDVSEGKLSALKTRVKRSEWQNIRLKHWDGQVVPDFGAELRQGFDRVIVDAPCTASGTWRRDPEGRYRVTARTVPELTAIQERLIRLGWSALRPGGKLAYVTCSWLPEENEAVAESLAREVGAAFSQELLGLPSFDANTVYSAILEKPRSAT